MAGTYAALKEIRVARETISFSADEIKEYEIKELPNGDITFNLQKATTYLADIPMTEWLSNTIQNALIKIEAQGELKFQHLTLYEKFVVNRNN